MQTGSGTIEYSDLKDAMKTLEANCTSEEIKAIFSVRYRFVYPACFDTDLFKRCLMQDADMWHEGKLNFREFLVCLALGHLMGFIPLNDRKSRADSGNRTAELESALDGGNTGAGSQAQSLDAPPSPTCAQVLALLQGTDETTPGGTEPAPAPVESQHHYRVSSGAGVLQSGQLEAASDSTDATTETVEEGKKSGRHSRRWVAVTVAGARQYITCYYWLQGFIYNRSSKDNGSRVIHCGSCCSGCICCKPARPANRQ
jgi:hypothetical protein